MSRLLTHGQWNVEQYSVRAESTKISTFMIIVLVDIIWFRGLSLPFHTVGDICMKAKHLISHQKWKNISKKIDRFRFLAKKGKHCIPSPSPTPPGRAFRGLP